MDSFAVPVMSEKQYQSFRREIGPDLADTYDEWLKFLGDKRAEAIRRGESVIEVEVDFDQFIAFCGAQWRSRDLKALLDFAIEKAARKKKK